LIQPKQGLFVTVTDSEKEVLFQYVKALAPNLKKEAIQELLQPLQVGHYTRNSILVRPKDVASKCYFVVKGCLRLFHIDQQGTEHTSGFYIEQDSLTILDGYRFQKPSPYGIQALEDCTLIEGTLQFEEQLKAHNPLLGPLLQRALEEELQKQQHDQARFRSQGPEERFQEFLLVRPGLAARVAQHHLASYLGIKPESLSRIKRRLLSEKQPKR